MLAVIPVRDGVLPSGGAETIAECGGRALVVGSSPRTDDLDGVAREVRLLDLGDYAPGRWSELIAGHIDDDVVVLPASPDGRDLAPRLAHELGRRLLAGAIQVTPHSVRLVRGGGLQLVDIAVNAPVVATLQPGVRGVIPLSVDAPACDLVTSNVESTAVDAAMVEVLPPDLATMDLVEADRIVGGGAGLDNNERFRQLADVARSIGASMGATRVITDRGWVEHQRQIGTTGVVVDPSLYLAFGISGAVQHTAGLGAPHHIISVNTDPHCPMMQMADLAIVADANAVLEQLEILVRG